MRKQLIYKFFRTLPLALFYGIHRFFTEFTFESQRHLFTIVDHTLQRSNTRPSEDR